MYDFANILFAGPCNRFCPWCIGKDLPDRVNESNLDEFPPRGLAAFLAEVNRARVRRVVFTGTVTDPQLYRHEARLLALLRERLHVDAELSLHTNGVLALKKIDLVNAYDRVCLSLPSFVPATYERLMGSPLVPDLAAIRGAVRVPLKVSCLVNEHNASEIGAFLERCHDLGVERVVLRRLYGDTRQWRSDWRWLEGVPRRGEYRGNPVYDYAGMEVTYWEFESSALRSLNLFADGTLGTSYELVKTPELKAS